MAHYKAGIGICGVVVGMVIGAGAIVYTQYSPVIANLVGSVIGEEALVAFRGIDPPLGREYQKRAISTFERLNNNASQIITEPRYPRSPEAEDTTASVSEQCTARLRVVAQLRSAVGRIVPATSDYTQVNAQLKAVLDSATAGCEPVVVHEQAMVSTAQTAVSPKVRVNNHCEQYDKQSQRYTRCIANERAGQRYEGKQ